ncbi:MAG: hypothetical protein V1859_05260 [archaeon]
MTDEGLFIPSSNADKGSTKDKIIAILTDESSINTKRIHFLLKKQYAQHITYQGVHKLVKQLVVDGVIEEFDHKYKLSKLWIDKLKLFIQRIESKTDTKDCTDPIKALDLIKNLQVMNIINLTFENISEYDKFFFDFIDFYTKKIIKEDEEIVFAQKHNRFPAMHPNILNNLPVESNTKIISYFIVCEGESILDNWGAGFFSENNMTVITGIKYNIDEDELFVIGNYIIRVYFPEYIKSELSSIYAKVKSLNEFYPNKLFNEIIKSQSKIVVSVQNNPHVAKTITTKLKKYYLADEFHYMLEDFKKQKIKPYTFDVEDLYVTRRQVEYYSNFVAPYLSDVEIKFIDDNIQKHLPYEIFKKNHINLIDISANIGTKAQKIFTNFYQNYKINYTHITPTNNMKETSEEFFFKIPSKEINYRFFNSKIKSLPEMDIFTGKREPSVFLFFDYTYGNYDSKFFVDILTKIVMPDDLIVITLQFTPDLLNTKAIEKLVYYYKHRYQGYRFDCGPLYEIGFREGDIEHETCFNKDKRQMESYSTIKGIPEKLQKQFSEIGIKQGDKILNYFSRKPSISQFEKEINKYFSHKIYYEKENYIGVAFCRLKTGNHEVK